MSYVTGEESLQDGTAQLQVSHMLPHLQQLSCFVQRCEQTAVQMVEQLAALYGSSKDSTRVIDATGIHFQVWLHTPTHTCTHTHTHTHTHTRARARTVWLGAVCDSSAVLNQCQVVGNVEC